ncbi:MAG: hypothetical protein K0R39_2335 [Symbiobacteriaceae bacterium]|jgi:hypothetical protein|nr:hypothetical protein [Symbiobacteriaceae bacterium]
MICHFQGGGSVRPAHRTLPNTIPPDPGPLGPVLARLIGRDVTLLAGRQEYTGRLLSATPVTLVDATGSVTIINTQVISVAF